MTVIDTHSPVAAEEQPAVDDYVAGVLYRAHRSAIETHARDEARAISDVAQRFAKERVKTHVSLDRPPFITAATDEPA